VVRILHSVRCACARILHIHIRRIVAYLRALLVAGLLVLPRRSTRGALFFLVAAVDDEVDEGLLLSSPPEECDLARLWKEGTEVLEGGHRSVERRAQKC
jgi:hypothetical protein